MTDHAAAPGEIDLERLAALLRELVPAWPRHLPDSATYLPGGYSHRNYRLAFGRQCYALRVATAARPSEGDYLRRLPKGVAPEVVAYDAAAGHLLTRWITGPVLAEAPPSPAEAGAYLAALAASIPVGRHRYDYGTEVAALLHRARRGGCLHEDVAAVAAKLSWQPSLLGGCHNDLNPWNVIRAAAGWRTLDWEQAGDNDPLFDLVGLCLGLGWGDERTAACLDAARRDGWRAPVSPQLLRDAQLAYRIREYAWAVAQIAAGRDRPEITAQARSMRAAVLAA